VESGVTLYKMLSWDM